MPSTGRGYRTGLFVLVLLVLAAWVGPNRVAAQESVAWGVPSDVFLFAHWTSRPRTGFADRHLIRVRDELRSAGIVDEFVRALEQRVEDEGERERFRYEAAYWTRTLARVDWWRLMRREVAIGARVGVGGRIEVVFLAQVGREARDEILLELREVLRGIVAVAGEYESVESERRGVPTAVFYSRFDPGEQICLGGRDGVVVVTTSAPMLRQSLELLEGSGSSRSLLRSEVYRSSRSELEPERDDASGAELSVFYRPGEAFEGLASLDAVAVYHCLASIGLESVRWNSRYELGDQDDNPLVRAFQGRASVSDFSTRIPKDVTKFSTCSGSHPTMLYDLWLDVLSILTGGPFLRDLIASAQSALKFDLKDDFLRFLSGRRTSFTYGPAKEDESAKNDEWIYQLELDDPSSAGEFTERVERAAKLAEGAGFSVKRGVPPEGDENADAFNTFEIESPSFGLRFAVAVEGTGVSIASTLDAIERAKATSAKDSILEQPGFLRLWDSPKGELDRVSYGDVPDDIETVVDAFRWIGGLARLLPDTGERGVYKPALLVLPRFRGAIRALDMFGRRIAYIVRDGRVFRGSGRIELKASREL